MARPDPIQYAERLYAAIRAANFSPMSFLSFGNAIKEGVAMRKMPRIAAEPFMRVVGEMLDFEEEIEGVAVVDVAATTTSLGDGSPFPADPASGCQGPAVDLTVATVSDEPGPEGYSSPRQAAGEREPNGG